MNQCIYTYNIWHIVGVRGTKLWVTLFITIELWVINYGLHNQRKI